VELRFLLAIFILVALLEPALGTLSKTPRFFQACAKRHALRQHPIPAKADPQGVRMLRHLSFVALTVALTVAGARNALAEEWQPLVDEPSRADLFARFIVPKTKDQDDQARAAALLGPFMFPVDTTYDKTKNRPRDNAIFGIDISHYEGTNIHFDQLKQQNVRFVYAKATQGVGYKDGRFEEYWAALAALSPDNRVSRGAYHFLSSSGDGTAQADRFLKFLEENGGLKSEDLPAVLDLEWDIATKNGPDRWQGQEPDEIIDKVLAWLGRVEEKTRKIPIVYTAKAWWRDRGIPEEKFARLSHYKVWVADYSKSSHAVETPVVPNHSHFDLWQFTEQAQLSTGYGGKLDANIYYGSDKKFISDFQIR
jgi:lysozyme